MAENVVEILVKSRDKTKAGNDAAVASAESAAGRVQAVWEKHGNAINTKLSTLGSGLGKGGGILAIGSAALAAAGPLGALTVAVGAFGAVAVPELSKVHAAMTKTGKAGQQAWKQLTPDQQQLGTAIKGVETSFARVTKTLAPVVDQVVALGARTLKDALPALAQLAKAGGKVLDAFLKPLDAFFKSKVFAQIIDQFSKFAVTAANLVGPAVVQLIKLLLQLFVQLMPSGVQILKVLLPLILQIVTNLTPVIVVAARVTAAILNWLTQTKLLKPVLLGLVPVLILLSSASGIGLIITAVALLVAGIVALSRNWRKIWADIKQWAADAWNFLTHGWGQLLIPGLTLIVKTVQFARDHWRDAWNAIRAVGQAFLSWYQGSLIAKIVSGIGSIVSWFKGLPGRISGAVGRAESVLLGWGKGVIDGLLSGVKNVWNSVLNFFKGIPKAILGALGIHSPPDWAIEAGTHIMNGIGIGVSMAKNVVSSATAKQIQASAIGALGGPATAGASQAQAYARSRLAAYGWGAGQMGPLIALWNQESGWNRLARNPSSGAYGIPQALPASKMGAAANPPQSSAAAQINWGLSYIKSRYGSPAGAEAHERAFNWYASGGPASGWAMVGEHGRELVRLPPGSQVYPNGTTNSMLSGGGAQVVQLQVSSGGQSEVERFMLWMIQHLVRIKGGGDVQKAFGR